jgi:ketosteroid isomerase-like protein
MSLIDEVRALVGEAGRETAGGPAAAAVADIAARLDEPLRVAFAGRVKAGKSTLLNALVGEELAPTDAGECTRIVTWYGDGHTYRVTLRLHDGSSRQAPFTRNQGALEIDLGGAPPDAVERLEVMWPSSRLAGVTLIDTPGLGSAREGASAPSHRFLAIADGDADADVDASGDSDGGEQHSGADAVIYLMRHLHQADLGFLEAFHDASLGAASPVNTIAVLSRADEVGACRPEAMQTARRVAQRYRADARLRRLAQTVVPVSGLVAQASVTLTEAEYRALAELAGGPRAEVDDLLLTVDRFVAENAAAAGSVTAVERERLLERLGLYGVRSSVRLIRLKGAASATELAGQLRDISGIEDLRRLLASLFRNRRDVLKARAALASLEGVLRQHPGSGAERLAAQLERVVASAHELQELQVVNALRNGLVPLPPDEAAEVERLLDHPGASLADRLGADEGEERAALLAAVERWRRRAEHPMSSRPVVETARAVVRTLEGLLPGL